jgi:hypothetical protein
LAIALTAMPFLSDTLAFLSHFTIATVEQESQQVESFLLLTVKSQSFHHDITWFIRLRTIGRKRAAPIFNSKRIEKCALTVPGEL